MITDVKQLVTQLFKINNIAISSTRMPLLEKFLEDKQNLAIIDQINQNQEQLMAKWKLEERIAEITQQTIRIPNATVGKPYEAKFDLETFNWQDIIAFEFEGLEPVGLSYNENNQQITGIPTQSGDIKFTFKFKVEGQPAEAALNQKLIMLIINPDPKSLWKNIESDKNDPYWKEDNVTMFAPLGDRHILASSKRGRSHANTGSFREDDIAFEDLANGWSIVVVADGAGSAKASRKGSAMACNGVIEYFQEPATIESMAEFDQLVQQHASNTGEDTQRNLTSLYTIIWVKPLSRYINNWTLLPQQPE